VAIVGFVAVFVAGVAVTLVQALAEASPVAQVLVGVGAFGTTLSSGIVLLRRRTTQPPKPLDAAPVPVLVDPKRRQLFHAAVASISDDLASLVGLVRERDHKAFFDWYSIKTRTWASGAAYLAVPEHPELHRKVRTAYQALARAFDDCEQLRTGRESYSYRLKDARPKRCFWLAGML
jgi:hypothetical protein